MKKKFMMLLCSMMMTVAANAQFEAGKVYVGSSLSGINMSYNGSEKANIHVAAKAGYLAEDNLMLTGTVGWNAREKAPDDLTLGVGGRYYIVQNGLYLGAGVTFLHNNVRDDFMPGVQIGYAFFLSRTVTVEPELYYDQSFKKHSDYSTVGLRIGVGIYL